MYSVYWIKTKDHTDPKSEGYIGITSQSIEKRFEEHKTNSNNENIKQHCNQENIEITCLHNNLTKQEALLLEKQYRPDWYIGWNIAIGGNVPPSRKGKVSPKTLLKGNARTKKQKEASKKHSKRMRGNKSSGKRKNRVIHKKICIHCHSEFITKNPKITKYCSIKCAARERNKNPEYLQKLSIKTSEKWKNPDYKETVSILIKKALSGGA